MKLNHPIRAGHRRSQQGAATMVVVMILFFIMAMMAAFANRNLMFEQRVASNYFRSAVAMEAADAGAEWALAMLNGTNVNSACVAAGSPTQSFRNRYVNINSESRVIQTQAAVATAVAASCVHNAVTGWVCQCPNSAWTQANAAALNQDRLQPSFTISFQDVIIAPLAPVSPGVIRIVSGGCSMDLPSNCININSGMDGSLGVAQVSVSAALVSALKMPPATPLTVKGTVGMDATGLGLHNTDPLSSGMLMVAGGTATGWVDSRLDSLPGTPPQQALIASDPSLQKDADKVFAMYFGMSPNRYRQQPAMRLVTCAADCAASLKTAYDQGVRLAWVDGPMNLGSNQILGAATSPMLVVATGDVVIDGAFQLTGLLYARGNVRWTNNSGSLSMVTGALISEGNLTSVGATDIWYQAAVMNELRNRAGSFVRVPGSWWDQPL